MSKLSESVSQGPVKKDDVDNWVDDAKKIYYQFDVRHEALNWEQMVR